MHFRSELLRLSQSGRPCPMCGAKLDSSALSQVSMSQLSKTKEEPMANGYGGTTSGAEDDGDDEAPEVENGHNFSASSSSSSSRRSSSRPNSNLIN